MKELTPQEIARHIRFEAAHVSGVVGVWSDDAPDRLKIFNVSIYRHYVSKTYRFHLRGPYKPKHVTSYTLDGVLALGFRMISKTLARSKKHRKETERLANLVNATIPHLSFEFHDDEGDPE